MSFAKPLSSPEDTTTHQPSPEEIAHERYLEDEILQNRYLEEKTNKILDEYEKVGAVEPIGIMTGEELDAFVEQHPIPLTTSPIFEADGRTILRYKVYRMDMEAIKNSKEKIDEIAKKSDEYYRGTFQAVESKKAENFDRDIKEGNAEFVGELSLDEYATYKRKHNLGLDELRMLFVFDKNGNVIRDKYKVYRRLKK
ncbi:MAG: hypothetical protein HY773_01820 [Candidatus Terrybacteria bacterium]|nr:hypothetical protein [Candidatus Terrybacteria bacterium]